MEEERRINWLSLFIKIIIIFVFLLIIIWLIAKIANNRRITSEYIKNLNNLQEISNKYFKNIDLPLEKQKSIKISLGELIEQKYISSKEKYLNSSCDKNNSYSEIIREDTKYNMITTLKCGDEKNTIQKVFLLEDCRNCNESSNESSSSNNKEETKVTYYEHTKETVQHTKWMRGNLTGANIENKYEYYGVEHQTYYTLGVVPVGQKEITYIIKLNKVPNNKYYFTTIKEANGFKNEEENNYLNEKNVSVYIGNIPNYEMRNLSDCSLNESNYTYKLSPYYREGSFYVKINISIKNTNGVETYYDNSLQKEVYLIPLKINVKFSSNDISETKPIGEYETISYYRYVTVNKETIWSTDKHIEGYTRTGNTKVK